MDQKLHFCTIGEAAKRVGVTVRTLHYYDEIGILKPASVSESGYREYSADNLKELGEIVRLRQAGVSLAGIREFLGNPKRSHKEALRLQLAALTEEKRKLEEKIMELERELKKPQNSDDMHSSYEEEARVRWEDTEAYKEYTKRTAKGTVADRTAFEPLAHDLFSRLADLEEKNPADPAVQKLVSEWQELITTHYYTCTKEILAGLGQMYTADPRFSQYICQHGSEDLAAFFGRAIEIYCQA